MNFLSICASWRFCVMTEKMPTMKRFVTTLEFEEQCEYVSFVIKGDHAYQISRLSRSIILTLWVMGYFCVATNILIVRFQLYPAGTFGAHSWEFCSLAKGAIDYLKDHVGHWHTLVSKPIASKRCDYGLLEVFLVIAKDIFKDSCLQQVLQLLGRSDIHCWTCVVQGRKQVVQSSSAVDLSKGTTSYDATSVLYIVFIDWHISTYTCWRPCHTCSVNYMFGLFGFVGLFWATKLCKLWAIICMLWGCYFEFSCFTQWLE